MLNKEETKFIEAAKTTVIRMVSNSQFGLLMEQFSLLCGATNQLKTEPLLIIRDMIIDTAGWITSGDIHLAGTLNAAKKLPAESEAYAKSENEPFDHVQIYGVLTPPKFFAIMKRYHAQRSAAMTKYRATQTAPVEKQLGMHVPTVTDEQWEEMHRKDVEAFKKGMVTWKLLAARMVTWLYESGRVSDAYFSDEVWKRMRQMARQSVMDRDQIGHGRIDRMNDWQKKQFNESCLLELRTVLYGCYMQREIEKSLQPKQ